MYRRDKHNVYKTKLNGCLDRDMIIESTVADKQSPLVCYRTKNFFLHKTDFRFGFAASQKA